MKLIYRGISYDRQPAADPASSMTETTQRSMATAPSQRLLYRGVEYYTNPTQSNTIPAAPVHGPVELVYRGVHYMIGANPSAETSQAGAVGQPAAPQPEPITELARELLSALRQKTDRREQSVLTRFQADIGLTDDGWTVYRHHDAAMS